MASATQVVSASAKKMASLTAAGLKVGLGAALAGGGVALAAGMKAVTSAADFEQTKVAFTTLIGDAAKAEQTLAQLRELGAKTPFEFPELADAGRKLIAFGEGSDTVAVTLARIGDVSAGVSAGVQAIYFRDRNERKVAAYRGSQIPQSNKAGSMIFLTLMIPPPIGAGLGGIDELDRSVGRIGHTLGTPRIFLTKIPRRLSLGILYFSKRSARKVTRTPTGFPTRSLVDLTA